MTQDQAELERVARRRMVRVTVPLVLVATVAGLGVAGLTFPTQPPWWVYAITLLYAVLVLALMLWLSLRRKAKRMRVSPLWAADYSERKRIGRAIWRRTSPPAGAEQLALSSARDLAARRWIGWAFLLAGLFQLPNAVINDSFGRWLSLLAGIGFLGNAAYFFVLCRRAGEAVARWQGQESASSVPG